jgi:hypothetical protein
MAEPRIVVPEVGGSSPLRHPNSLLRSVRGYGGTRSCGADPGTVAQIVAFFTRTWQPIEGWIEGIGIRVPPDTIDMYDVSFASHLVRKVAY